METRNTDNKLLDSFITSVRDSSISQRVVYTAIFGNIDVLKEVDNKDLSVSYRCFTDNRNLKSNTWKITYCEDLFAYPRLTAKVFKLFPNLIFPNSEESLWVDATFSITGNLTEFFDEYIKDKPIIFFRHPLRDCVYKEAKICALLGKDEDAIIKTQINDYKALGMPKKNGLVHGGIIFRKHHRQEISKLMEDWWVQINKYSIRDQLSLNFVAWMNGIELHYFTKRILDNNFFEWGRPDYLPKASFLKGFSQKILTTWINIAG
ncbi:uncharacterized protein METZ01_LOCUS225215 [marine metagenome]|uniref:TOD1/MUCI70 glycosyltransferase-like domain-containing protein n=1 Tax=marine metagenome TaxID=408172 RepID=A0A382GDW8_9ZZZZ